MTNRYAGTCILCGDRVLPERGRVSKDTYGKWVTTHNECPRDVAERQAAEAYEYRDEDNADAYVAWAIDLAWRERRQVGTTEQSAWYDHTTYEIDLIPGVTAEQVRSRLARDDGKNAYAYGKFGGYSTISSVRDQGDGTALVVSAYHIGD